MYFLVPESCFEQEIGQNAPLIAVELVRQPEIVWWQSHHTWQDTEFAVDQSTLLQVLVSPSSLNAKEAFWCNRTTTKATNEITWSHGTQSMVDSLTKAVTYINAASRWMGCRFLSCPSFLSCSKVSRANSSRANTSLVSRKKVRVNWSLEMKTKTRGRVSTKATQERERERERESVCVCVWVWVWVRMFTKRLSMQVAAFQFHKSKDDCEDLAWRILQPC